MVDGRRLRLMVDDLVLELEHLVVRVVLHHVGTGTDVAFGDEVDLERISLCAHAVGGRIVAAIEGTVRLGCHAPYSL